MRERRALTIAILLLTLAACRGQDDTTAVQLTQGGDPEQGSIAIRRFGCGACHVIPGIPNANGRVGPSLAGIASRMYLAGQVPNQPDQMMLWITDPQKVAPGPAMPDMNVSEAEARDIAAYLHTLR